MIKVISTIKRKQSIKVKNTIRIIINNEFKLLNITEYNQVSKESHNYCRNRNKE